MKHEGKGTQGGKSGSLRGLRTHMNIYMYVSSVASYTSGRYCNKRSELEKQKEEDNAACRMADGTATDILVP